MTTGGLVGQGAALKRLDAADRRQMGDRMITETAATASDDVLILATDVPAKPHHAEVSEQAKGKISRSSTMPHGRAAPGIVITLGPSGARRMVAEGDETHGQDRGADPLRGRGLARGPRIFAGPPTQEWTGAEHSDEPESNQASLSRRVWRQWRAICPGALGERR